MIQSTPLVDAAFTQLTAALGAELAELEKIGAEVFHDTGAPRNAQSLLRLAKANARLRDQINHLHEQWKSGIPIKRPTPTSPSSFRVVRIGKSGPGLIRNIKGLSDREAAKKLGVKPARLKAWLEAGTLKGFRRVNGSWKIPTADFIDFIRNHRDLI